MGKPKPSAKTRRPSPEARDDSLLTLAEAARQFMVSVRTLQRFRARGRLPGVRQGRNVLVRRSDVERALSWQDPTSLLRTLLAAEDDASLDSWMEGWKQLTRMTATDPNACAAWIAWADEATRRHPGFRVADYRLRHLRQSAENPVRHDHVDHLVHALGRFSAEMVARDALRTFHTSVAPWTQA